MSDGPGAEQLTVEGKDLVMHVALPIDENLILMASDCVPSADHVLNKGNHMYISVSPDNREEAARLFNGLSAGEVVEMPLEDQFWAIISAVSKTDMLFAG